ncbi:MAG: MATE family efflux transporter [Armatimonadetes bacterium]|nr:MATE family efflux transporter [Armatimonadota bacterium]
MSKDRPEALPNESEAGEHAGPSVNDERSYNRIVWDLAWPAVALNSLQTVNSLLDAKFLGVLGRDSLSASGGALNVMFFFMSLAFALGTGATALVSRFYGAGESFNLIKACRQATSLGIVLGLVFASLGALLVPFAARLFVGDNDIVYRELIRYLYPAMVGVPAFYTFITLAASLRAVGDTLRPMYVSGFQILVHIVLNFLLMFPSRDVTLHLDVFGWQLFDTVVHVPGAGWGIAGAGWAFAISAWVAVLIYFPVASQTVLGPVWRLQMLSLRWAWRIFRIAAPAALGALIRVTSFMAFTAALKYTAEGTDALGALRVGFSMESLAFMPAFGYYIAASALVGQSLGMNDPDRAERLAWSATHQAVGIMTVMSVIFLIFAPQLAGFFVDDPVQLKSAIIFLRIMALTEPLFGYGMVLMGAHQGAGDTVRPMIVSFVTMWLIRAPGTWVFAVWLHGDSTAAWWVMGITQGINGLIMIWLFKQGKWKEKRV